MNVSISVRHYWLRRTMGVTQSGFNHYPKNAKYLFQYVALFQTFNWQLHVLVEILWCDPAMLFMVHAIWSLIKTDKVQHRYNIYKVQVHVARAKYTSDL